MPRKVLVYSTLFPSRLQPIKGLFVAEFVKFLSLLVDVVVLAPVLALRNVREIWGGQRQYIFNDTVQVRAPLCVNVPGVLKSTDARFMAAHTRQAFRKSLDNTDLVHAHFAYPDAVAAGILASEVGLPFIVTVHGSDINVLARYPNRRYQILETLRSANAVVAVASDLKKKVIELGVSEESIYHIPNGVDISKFHPGDKSSVRKKLGVDHFKRLLLGVGRLVHVKAFDRLLKAVSDCDRDTGLLLVGDGRERSALEHLAKALGIRDRVKFAGNIDHDELPQYYHAADFLVISSHSEGWPTVIFEALACGVPIIGNNVGGIPEALSSPDLGLIIESNDSDNIRKGIQLAFKQKWDQKAIVRKAQQHSWNTVAEQYMNIYKHVLSEYYPNVVR